MSFEALELRDELLIACREVLLGVGTRQASTLIAHIDALLDLDDERSTRIAAMSGGVPRRQEMPLLSSHVSAVREAATRPRRVDD